MSSLDEIDINWKTTISIIINGKALPIIDFSYRVGSDAEWVDVLESLYPVGFHNLPFRFEASFTTLAIQGAGKHLHDIQMQHTPVAFVAAIKDGDDWTFKRLAFYDGMITNVAGNDIKPGSVPKLAVSAKFTRFDYEGKE